MKLAFALGLCALTPWIPVQVPEAGSDAVRASVVDARTLRLEQDGRQSVLTLAELPAGARLQAAEAARLLETGTVVALVAQVGQGFEYRYLCRREAGEWGVRQVAGAPPASDGWWLSAPLFAAPGEAYRIVDVHASESDAFELTFRRGWPSVRGDEVRLDEVIVPSSARPTCPAASCRAGCT
jgi:hypothetical protein